MKVTPVTPEQKIHSDKEMPHPSKADRYSAIGIHTLVFCLGFSPYKMKKETGEVSFKWLSFETIWSLIRLVIFNSPFSILPIVLMAFLGTGELEQEEMSGFSNDTSETSSTSTVTVYAAVSMVEYISCYSYFILSRVAKKLCFFRCDSTYPSQSVSE